MAASAATLALEAYRTRLGAVLAFIDDAASARIQLPTEVGEMTATLDGLLEYFLAGEAAFTATGPALASHTTAVEDLAASIAELEREETASAVLALQLQQLSGRADSSISALTDASEALDAAAATGACRPCELRRELPCRKHHGSWAGWNEQERTHSTRGERPAGLRHLVLSARMRAGWCSGALYSGCVALQARARAPASALVLASFAARCAARRIF